jgi:amino acid adenylation domain-containing protein
MKPTTTYADSVIRQTLEVAIRCPDSIAISDREQTLSYGELDYKADRFAGYLIQLGVVPGDSVIICMERSFDWITAALGIMKAGACYVPLDSTWPDSRLRFAIIDSGARAFVGRRELLDRLQIEMHGVDPIREAGDIARACSAASIPIEPDSLAYIVYTSGTAGVPKGVEITHANLLHLIQWHRKAFGVSSADRASHLAGLGFDAAVWEIWPNLCAGSTLCIADDSIRLSAESIQRWMVSERVTVGFVPTVYAAPMMAMKWPVNTALRFLLTGGDTLRLTPHEPLPFKVVNNYGPAECTVVSTSHVLDTDSESVPPIGHAITGARVYVLDEDRQLVADDAVGEIYIGGNGVGRGYRNLPDASQLAFIPDPFAVTSGARMYRTGDRGIRRVDGVHEFRGRLDRQIKIRGQRVELDEVGNTLAKHPGIEFGIATTNSSPQAPNQLIAHFLPKDQAGVPTVNELQAHLLKHLPDYMVPSIFVQLQSLPLSPNGKIDLGKLPQPSTELRFVGTEAQMPTSDIEKRLLRIVRELLGGLAVSAHDNLFLSGGHSLFGMQLLTRVKTTFSVDLTLHELFESPTVEGLASLIETRLREKDTRRISDGSSGPMHVGPTKNCIEVAGCSQNPAATQFRTETYLEEQLSSTASCNGQNAQKRIGHLEEHLKKGLEHSSGVLALHASGTRKRVFWVHNLVLSLARELGDDQPFFIVTLTASDLGSLGDRPTLRGIAACLLGKIVATQPSGPYIIGGLCIGSVLAYEIASQMRAAGHEVALLVMIDAPTQPYLKSCTSFGTKLGHPLYSIQRVVRIGFAETSIRVCKSLFKHVPYSIRMKFSKRDWYAAHELIERAAFAYYPQQYDGEVLLLLSADPPAHLDFLPGWQSVIRQDLHTAFVDGHHREFLTPQNVDTIAEIISGHLARVVRDDSVLHNRDSFNLESAHT